MHDHNVLLNQHKYQLAQVADTEILKNKANVYYMDCVMGEITAV